MKAITESKSIGGQDNELNLQHGLEESKPNLGGEVAPIQEQSPEQRCESIFCQMCQG